MAKLLLVPFAWQHPNNEKENDIGKYTQTNLEVFPDIHAV